MGFVSNLNAPKGSVPLKRLKNTALEQNPFIPDIIAIFFMKPTRAAAAVVI